MNRRGASERNLQVDKDRDRIKQISKKQIDKKEKYIENLLPEQLVNELKEKGLPVFGTNKERQDRLKKACGVPIEPNSKKKNTLDEIDAISKRREERRKKMEEERIFKQEKRFENEAQGRMGDIEFQLMINDCRSKLTKARPHTPATDMKICVCVRKRPIFKKEENSGEIDSTSCVNPSVIVHEPKYKVDGITRYLDNQEFLFDNAYGETDDTDSLYLTTLQPLIPFILNSGTVTCFAYGQTGSGKTFTMKGLQHSVVSDLFKHAGRYIKSPNFMVSFFEIYGGRAYDLLNSRNQVRIMEDGNQNIQVQGLVERPAVNEQEVHSLIDNGNAERTTHATTSNSDSSRSHAVCSIYIRDRNQVVGKLILVDLAGSERAEDCKSNNRQRRIEGAEINKSLLALKECIRAHSNGDLHVPYRGSKLTLVLRDSFTGSKNRIVMITCISPGHSSADHTVNSLRYAARLKDRSRPERPVLIAKNNNMRDQSPISSSFSDEAEQREKEELDQFHKKVEHLLEKEEELLTLHVSAIKEDAQILTVEGDIIDKVQGERVIDYDIDSYVKELERLIYRKLSVYKHLHEKLTDFKKCLSEEEEESHNITKTFNFGRVK